MKSLKSLLVVFCALLCTLHTYAQEYQYDTLGFKVYFKQSSSKIDTTYQGNAARLREFGAHLDNLLSDTTAFVSYIAVSTGASPDGDTEMNERLSAARALELSKFLSDHFDISPHLFRTTSVGEDWEGLAEAVSKLDVPWKNQVLKIIDNPSLKKNKEGILVDTRKDQIKAINKREAWDYMAKNVFPDLRSSNGAVTCIVQKPTTERITIKDTVFLTVKEIVRDTIYVKVPYQVAASKVKKVWDDRTNMKPTFAARTNILAIPFANLGVEVPVSRNWSVGADMYYPWIWRGKNTKTCNQLWGFDIEGRYWFSDNRFSEECRLLGHSVGTYFGAGYYDFERNWSGHQGTFINFGVDYLYSMPLFGGRVHLEFELGLGYIRSKAIPYKYLINSFYKNEGSYRIINWIGPTKAQISVSIPIQITQEHINKSKEFVATTGKQIGHFCKDIYSDVYEFIRKKNR